jgi:hypothetical protein
MMTATDTRSEVSTADLHLRDGYPAPYSPTLTADDRAEIIELTARFNLAVDSRNFDQLGPLFLEDGILDHQWGYRESAAEAESLVRENEPNEKQVRHQNTNHVLVLDDDGSVTMTSYLLALLVAGGPDGVPTPLVIAHGFNTHVVRRREGRWKIAHMTLDQTTVNSALLGDHDLWLHDAATAEQRAVLDGRHG